MFKKNHENFQNNEQSSDSIIGSNVRIDGEFAGQGDLKIEGVVTGKITVEKNLKIGVNAKIIGNVEAENIIINGSIKGNITAKNELKLSSSANVRGDVFCQKISIDLGAKLNGKCSVSKEEKIKEISSSNNK